MPPRHRGSSSDIDDDSIESVKISSALFDRGVNATASDSFFYWLSVVVLLSDQSPAGSNAHAKNPI